MKIKRMQMMIFLAGNLGCGMLYCAVWNRFLKTQAPYCLEIFSIADMLVEYHNVFMFLCYQVFPLLLGCTVFGIFQPSFSRIIYYGSKRRYFLMQERSAIWISGVVSGFYESMIILCGISAGKIWMNWNLPNSYFSAVNHMVLQDASVWNVLLGCLVLSWLKNYIVINILLLFQWIKGWRMIGIVVVLAGMIAEWKLPKLSLVLRTLTPSYQMWSNGELEKTVAISMILIIGFVLFQSRVIVKKREFLSEKSNNL